MIYFAIPPEIPSEALLEVRGEIFKGSLEESSFKSFFRNSPSVSSRGFFTNFTKDSSIIPSWIFFSEIQPGIQLNNLPQIPKNNHPGIPWEIGPEIIAQDLLEIFLDTRIYFRSLS